MYGLQSSPSVCFLEYILCKKEGLGMLGRLVSRKEAQLKVKRGLRVCALLGRDRALASFSPVTVLSLAFEILSNHVHGIHLMMHRWGGVPGLPG